VRAKVLAALELQDSVAVPFAFAGAIADRFSNVPERLPLLQKTK
jgi:hypothetical protein